MQLKVILKNKSYCKKSFLKHLENLADYSVKHGKRKRDGERVGKV